MPATTPDQLKEKAAQLRTQLEAKKAKLDPARTRALAKKIRRVQRRRRVIVARAARLAGGAAKKES